MTTPNPPAGESKPLKVLAAQATLIALFVGALGLAYVYLSSPATTKISMSRSLAVDPNAVVARQRVKPTTNPTPRVIDLFEDLNLQTATVNGEWQRKNGAAVSDEGQATRIDFGYRPPAEYDLAITFIRRTGSDGIDTVLCAEGRQFAWTMAGWGNAVAGFGEQMARYANTNPTQVHFPGFENGRRYECVMKVRHDRVQAYLDGTLLREWITDYDDLAMNHRSLLRTDTIGISTWESSYEIYSAQLTEIGGEGKHVTRVEPLTAVPIAAVDLLVADRPVARHTLYSNGHIKSPDGEDLWFLQGNRFIIRWGVWVDACVLSPDRKTFTGRTVKGEPVSGTFVAGGL